jgi:hypothetical protein
MRADQTASETPEVIRLFPTLSGVTGRGLSRTSLSTPLPWACSEILRRELPPLPRGEAWDCTGWPNWPLSLRTGCTPTRTTS